jgi:sec-independent protein translocase protein TatA
MLSSQNLLILLAIVAVLFGARKLPEIGKGVGEAIKNFKKGISEQEHIDVTPTKEDTAKEDSAKVDSAKAAEENKDKKSV